MSDASAILRAVRSDITGLDVDAIVNAANSSLLGGCDTGQAKITRGYRLPARFIIHTVGPVWRGGGHGETERLADCYRNSLLLARKSDLRSVAFPAISTGVYGFPAEPAARIAVDTTREFLATDSVLREIVFCCFSAPDLARYETLLS